jgi:5-methyltetrahydrofolate--homocysteine methyltransferase
MKSVFPLAKKYGGVIIALTLDENGIPETAEGRVKIAEKILAEAEKYGISKKDIVFDTLAMTISTDTNSASVTLSALNKIRNSIGCHTSLGVSNVSFGLPCREAINSTFFALALENGLSAAIMNPYSSDMMKAYYAFNALRGLDENCVNYIDKASSFTQSIPVSASIPQNDAKNETECKSALQDAIMKGLKDKAHDATNELLKTVLPLDIVQNEIIPALDEVGKGFESKTVYLPQLLMSAESAKSAFECIKTALVSQNKSGADKCKIVIATVHGDIHDIGKNIVKLLLENYGFDVTDLGKDVPPEVIVDKVKELHAPIAALSALMTTTVPAMEATIKLLHEEAPWCKTVVGGAVLNKDYADAIGADMYAKNAMETVRYAEKVSD